MTRLVELCGTPCVHTGAAVIPGTHGRPSQTDGATVVVLGVTGLASVAGDHVVLVDGGLRAVSPVWSEARVIGRASCAHRRPARVRSGAGEESMANLPEDLHVGDLIAVPCSGMVVLRDLRVSVVERRAASVDPSWLSRLD